MSKTDDNKPVRVSDPLTRLLVGILGASAIGFGTWFANEVQKNSVNTSVLTQRVNMIEVHFPEQIRELKADIRGDINELKEMVRRLERKP